MICCHPANLHLIQDMFQRRHTTMTHNGPVVNFFGEKVITDINTPRWFKKWKFPDAPFIEYDTKDEEWARPLKYGCEVDDVGNPVFFRINL